MRRLLDITDVEFRRASAHDVGTGLLGWVAIVIDGAIRIDGISVRRNSDGRLSLSFPRRNDRAGVTHPIVRPLSVSAREAIEREVIDELRSRGAVP
jgi:DNA-binding cell septation regulator SpoVG